jgi:hypothetical protein
MPPTETKKKTCAASGFIDFPDIPPPPDGKRRETSVMFVELRATQVIFIPYKS